MSKVKLLQKVGNNWNYKFLYFCNAPAVNVRMRAPSLEIDLETFQYYKQQQQQNAFFIYIYLITLFNDFSLLSLFMYIVQQFFWCFCIVLLLLQCRIERNYVSKEGIFIIFDIEVMQFRFYASPRNWTNFCIVSHIYRSYCCFYNFRVLVVSFNTFGYIFLFISTKC